MQIRRERLNQDIDKRTEIFKKFLKEKPLHVILDEKFK